MAVVVASCSGHWRTFFCRRRVSPSTYSRPWFSSAASASSPTRHRQEEAERKGPAGAASMVSGYTEFLLKGSTAWREAPHCPDYVGPVVVAKTSDGCGRGLFATEDVRAGTLLLISNPMAITFDDPLRMHLLTELVSAAEKDPRFRRQIYTLAHAHDAQNCLPVPPMDLLTSNSAGSGSGDDGCHAPPVDLTRIMDIMMLNSFEGELSNQDMKSSKTRLSGLWLIPSLINHSCHRNASRLVVRGAMVIHAAADIRKGEEITITYVDILAPLHARKKSFQDMKFGFSCMCKRCALERSLESYLADVSGDFASIHEQATEEVYKAVFSQTPLPLDTFFPGCMKMSKLFQELQKKVCALECLSELEMKWILSGYSSAFLCKWLVDGYTSRFAKFASFLKHDVAAVVDAVQTTIPGLLHTLSLIAILQSLAENSEGNGALAKHLFKQGIDECARVYGNLELSDLIKLMEKSRDYPPIF